MKQPVYTMFITNNRTSFYLWWKENLVEHQKVSKYYENDCLQNAIMFFVPLLTATVVENSHIQVGIYLIFLETVLKQTWKSFKFRPPWKNGKSS